MRLTDPNRRALLEELFPREGMGKSGALNDTLEIIQREKQARGSRRQSLLVAAGAVLLAGVALFIARDSTARPEGAAARELAAASTIASQPASQPFQVERVDDEGLLKLLDETPIALVRWPDGSRTLMLVVQTSPSG